MTDFDSAFKLDVNDAPFPNFAPFYGPLSAPDGHGNYMNLNRLDISSSNYDKITGGIVMSGHGNNTNLAPQVFDNANVILISDRHAPVHVLSSLTSSSTKQKSNR